MFTMLPKYFKMFTIILSVCSFGPVYSQTSVALNSPYSSSTQYQSFSGPGSTYVATSGTPTLYSGFGSSYIANSGSAVSSTGSLPAFSPVTNAQLQPLFPPVLNPNAESFAHVLTQVLQSSPVLNAIGNFVLNDAYTLIYKIGIIILERDNIQDTSLAQQAAEAGKDVGVVSRDLYYNAITHMFAKLLSLYNLLTQETTVTYPRIILSYVENYGIQNGISDPESVLKAVANGVLNFATSIGINNVPNLTLAFQLFVQELIALSSGAEV